MTEVHEWVVIARIGHPYGVKGWVHVHAFTEDATSVFAYSAWHLHKKSANRTLTLVQGREHGKGLVAKFEGIDDRDAADLLRGSEVKISRSLLPVLSQTQFYWSDLEGCEVVDEQAKLLGRVDYLYEIGQQDLMLIRGEKGEVHIPFIFGDTVKTVDLNEKRIVVDWVLP